jgi:hypothetical protein
MGIGVALATGLVQGFTQNIGRELERRTAEKEKLEGYRLAVANALMTGGDDLRKSGVEAVQSMIEGAQGRLDKQKGIDLFGTAGDSIFGDEGADFTDMIASLSDTTSSTSSLMIGQNFDLVDHMSPDLTERLEKDRSNPLQLGTITMQGLNQYYNKVGEAKFMEAFSSVEDKNALRNVVRTSVKNISKGDPTSDSFGKVTGFAGDFIANYDFYDRFLGLNSDSVLNANLVEGNAAAAEYYNSTLEEGEDAETAADFITISGTAYGNSGVNRHVRIAELQEHNIDISTIDALAASQGRTRDVFMLNFSKQYDNPMDVYESLGHAMKIAKLAQRGDAFTFDTMDVLVSVGDYLDENVTDRQQQALIIQGIQGSVLTANQRRDIAYGDTSIDQYRAGTNRVEGFAKVYGEAASYSQFKERVDAARKAASQLKDYIKIVDGITTPAGTLLDSGAALIESIFSAGGSIDQLVTMIIGDQDSYDGDREQISSALEYLKNEGGDRAKRDSLAFIIAANMARAEDSAGRLSDGDLQRNLEKIRGRGFRGKQGEIKAIDVVLRQVESQLKNLGNIEAATESREAAQGFSVPLQNRIQALRTRDLALKSYRATLSAFDDAGMPPPAPEMTAAQLIAGMGGETPTHTLVNKYTASGGGMVIVDLLSKQHYVISQDNTQVLHSGTRDQLVRDKHITYVQAGSTASISAAQPDTTLADTSNQTDQAAVILPDTNKSMVVTDTVTRKGSIGDGGSFDTAASPADPVSPVPDTPVETYTPADLVSLGVTPVKRPEGGYTIPGKRGIFDLDIGTNRSTTYTLRPGSDK